MNIEDPPYLMGDVMSYPELQADGSYKVTTGKSVKEETGKIPSYPEGYKLISTDYSDLETRVIAQELYPPVKYNWVQYKSDISDPQDTPPNHGAIWTRQHEGLLYSMFPEADLSTLCTKLGRSPRSILEKLTSVKLLTRRNEGTLYRYTYWYKAPITKPQPIADWHKVPAAESGKSQPTTEEPIMSNVPTIETKTFIGGVDAANMSDNAIFSKMADKERERKQLLSIETKSKKLQAVIDQITKDLEALRDYVDARP